MTTLHIDNLQLLIATVITALRRAPRTNVHIYCGDQLVWASYDSGKTHWCNLPMSKQRELARYYHLQRSSITA